MLELAPRRLPETDARAILANATAVIGLHPDGATDAIVDFALEARLSFAIVPCCTYDELS